MKNWLIRNKNREYNSSRKILRLNLKKKSFDMNFENGMFYQVKHKKVTSRKKKLGNRIPVEKILRLNYTTKSFDMNFENGMIYQIIHEKVVCLK